MNYAAFVPIAIVLVFVFLTVTVCAVLSRSREIRQRKNIPDLHQNVGVLLRDALGDFPVPELSMEPLPSGWDTIKTFIAIFLAISVICLGLYLIALKIVGLLWPSMLADPTLRSGLSLLTFAVFAWGIVPVANRMLLFSRGSQPFSRTQMTIASSITFLEYASIPTYVVAIAGLIIFSGVELPVVPFLFPYFLLVAIPIIFWFSNTFNPYTKALQNRLYKADYERALALVRMIESKIGRTAGTLYGVGAVLLSAGNLQEAESVLRDCLYESLKTGNISSYMLINYGFALFRLGRYDQATRLFEGVIKLFPLEGAAYAGLAEVNLFQGHHPELALRAIGQFSELQRGASLRANQGDLRSRLFADVAWAQAMQGKSAEAERSLRTAFDRVNKRHRPSFAELNYRAGQVMRQIEDDKRAKEYFKQARQLDRNGLIAQLAHKELQDMRRDSLDN